VASEIPPEETPEAVPEKTTEEENTEPAPGICTPNDDLPNQNNAQQAALLQAVERGDYEAVMALVEKDSSLVGQLLSENGLLGEVSQTTTPETSRTDVNLDFLHPDIPGSRAELLQMMDHGLMDAQRQEQLRNLAPIMSPINEWLASAEGRVNLLFSDPAEALEQGLSESFPFYEGLGRVTHEDLLQALEQAPTHEGNIDLDPQAFNDLLGVLPLAGIGTTGRVLNSASNRMVGDVSDPNFMGPRLDTSSINPPNLIYSTRELVRRADEPGPFHNFPESFNNEIFAGTRTVVSPNYVQYTKPGTITLPGKPIYGNSSTIIGEQSVQKIIGYTPSRTVEGVFEIGVRPSASNRTEVIIHRFFRPNE
jgi:hypothetical protein